MSKKKSQLIIELDPNLHAAFKSIAQSKDRKMSVLVRDYIRDYVKKNGQGDLFKN